MANFLSMSALKVVFFTHLILIIWSIEGEWLRSSYMFYNTLFLLILLWAIRDHEHQEPVLMTLLINSLCTFMDFVEIIVHFPKDRDALRTFSCVMAILNLILRPVSTIVLYRIFTERSGDLTTQYGIPTFGRYFDSPPKRGGQYENLDHGQAHHQPFGNEDVESGQRSAYNADLPH